MLQYLQLHYVVLSMLGGATELRMTEDVERMRESGSPCGRGFGVYSVVFNWGESANRFVEKWERKCTLSYCLIYDGHQGFA